jgi:hypothetical protein
VTALVGWSLPRDRIQLEERSVKITLVETLQTRTYPNLLSLTRRRSPESWGIRYHVGPYEDLPQNGGSAIRRARWRVSARTWALTAVKLWPFDQFADATNGQHSQQIELGVKPFARSAMRWDADGDPGAAGCVAIGVDVVGAHGVSNPKPAPATIRRSVERRESLVIVEDIPNSSRNLGTFSIPLYARLLSGTI